jgi:hypothetical protein
VCLCLWMRFGFSAKWAWSNYRPQFISIVSPSPQRIFPNVYPLGGYFLKVVLLSVAAIYTQGGRIGNRYRSRLRALGTSYGQATMRQLRRCRKHADYLEVRKFVGVIAGDPALTISHNQSAVIW